MAVCVIGWQHALGVDVEQVRGVESGMEIARRYFAPAESAWLARLDPSMRSPAFTRLWALKEAYVKGTGRGLEQPLDGFAFALDTAEIRFHAPATDDAAAWRFFECCPEERYRIALAVRCPAAQCIDLDARPMRR
jgi:4'-phosphopantetheinyl transferase